MDNIWPLFETKEMPELRVGEVGTSGATERQGSTVAYQACSVRGTPASSGHVRTGLPRMRTVRTGPKIFDQQLLEPVKWKKC